MSELLRTLRLARLLDLVASRRIGWLSLVLAAVLVLTALGSSSCDPAIACEPSGTILGNASGERLRAHGAQLCASSLVKLPHPDSRRSLIVAPGATQRPSATAAGCAANMQEPHAPILTDQGMRLLDCDGQSTRQPAS